MGAEDGLQIGGQEEGIGTVVLSPLAQGLLNKVFKRYTGRFPGYGNQDFLSENDITEDLLAKLRN